MFRNKGMNLDLHKMDGRCVFKIVFRLGASMMSRMKMQGSECKNLQARENMISKGLMIQNED